MKICAFVNAASCNDGENLQPNEVAFMVDRQLIAKKFLIRQKLKMCKIALVLVLDRVIDSYLLHIHIFQLQYTD